METDVYAKVGEFFKRYPLRTYPKGQILIFGGQAPESVYYIVAGKVRVYDISYRGDEVIVNIFKPPAFFPMAWALNKGHNQFFYKTETETSAHVIPPEDAVTFLRDNPDVTLDLLARLYRGVDSVLSRVVHLMSGTAKSRLIYELVIECRRFGVKQNKDRYSLLTHEGDLAARSGLSRETISREMKTLKKQNLISVDVHGITVNDLPKLEKILETLV